MKPCVLLAVVFCGACSQGLGPVVPKTPMERQMIGLLQKFDRWDEDGDGELGQTELQAGIDSLKGHQTQVTYQAADVVAFYDTNHNGKVSMSEAQAGYQRSAEAEARLQR